MPQHPISKLEHFTKRSLNERQALENAMVKQRTFADQSYNIQEGDAPGTLATSGRLGLPLQAAQ